MASSDGTDCDTQKKLRSQMTTGTGHLNIMWKKLCLASSISLLIRFVYTSLLEHQCHLQAENICLAPALTHLLSPALHQALETHQKGHSSLLSYLTSSGTSLSVAQIVHDESHLLFVPCLVTYL